MCSRVSGVLVVRCLLWFLVSCFLCSLVTPRCFAELVGVVVSNVIHRQDYLPFVKFIHFRHSDFMRLVSQRLRG